MSIIWYRLKEELLLSKIRLLSWRNRFHGNERPSENILDFGFSCSQLKNELGEPTFFIIGK